MKQLSQEIIRILVRARDEDSFADAVINDPERTLRLYEFTAPELDYLKSFKSKQELQREYHEYLKAGGNPIRWRSFTPLIILAWLLVLMLAAYILASLYVPQVVTFLGLPLWDSLRVPFKWALIIYGGLASVIVIASLGRLFVRLDPTARVAVLIGVVIFVFIPGSVLISILSDSERVTLTRVLLTLIFTILPASLYSLFITTRGKTLWDEFVVNLVRLDPVGYEQLVPIYRKKFSALYGSPDQSGFGSALVQGEASFPVLFATFLVGLGWILFFSAAQPETLVPLQFADALMGGFVSPFTFGFLGAYLFSLHMLFRRYVQSDLKSVAYTHISQRILLTWVWAFVLNVVAWERFGITDDNRIAFVSVLAFVVGVFPDIAWQVVTQFIRLVLSFPLPSFREKNPLHEIEGITIWVEARLLEEDVENVENLITTGIVDLMLRTNLKPERIVHWIDQGVLRLHLGRDKRNPLQQALRERGIMTATDLMYAYKATTATALGGASTVFLSDKLDLLVRDLVVAIEDDPNMYHIQAWREMNAARSFRLRQAVEAQIYKETQSQTLSESIATAPMPSPTIVTQPAISQPAAQTTQTAPTAPPPVEAARSDDEFQNGPIAELPFAAESIPE